MSWILGLILILCLIEGLRRFTLWIFSLIAKGCRHLEKKMIEEDPMILSRMAAKKQLNEEWENAVGPNHENIRLKWARSGLSWNQWLETKEGQKLLEESKRKARKFAGN